MVFRFVYSLFRGQKAKILDSAAYDSKSGNPFSDRPPTSRRNEEAQRAVDVALAELDSIAPENFDASVWERLCRYRRAKIEFEMNVSCCLLKVATRILASNFIIF